jgi:D-glycero-D-manno-heptose 1,7-bisphosphate phosphatase
MRRAVFLDRDGVLVRDQGPLTHASQIELLAGVAAALTALKRADFELIVVSNQTAVARGLLDAAGVIALQGEIERAIFAQGGPRLDGFYFCPHHPRASLPELRCDCECRKPAPGLLRQAAAERGIELERSFMVGDRPSDIVAGYRAGCSTILLRSGAHTAAPIEVSGGFELRRPDREADSLTEAADYVTSRARVWARAARARVSA